MNVHPHPGLVRVLRGAYRCPHVRSHGGACLESRWHPEAGHVPRGFLGATGALEDVELIMVLAEPGNPQSDLADPRWKEAYDSSLDAPAMVRQAAEFVYRCYAERRGPAHRHGRDFLDRRFQGMPFADQLRRVWITEARLCSLDVSGGAGTVEHYRQCGRDYLAPQLALLPQARIVAFGSKAIAAMKRRHRPSIGAHALTPRDVKRARRTWDDALRALAKLDARERPSTGET